MDFIFGLAHPGDNLDAVKNAGIGWIRIDIPWPFDKTGKKHSEKFIAVRKRIKHYREMGFEIMGITPFPGFSCEYPPSTKEYYECYKKGCEYIAKYYFDDINLWQICNEPDIAPFRQGLGLEDMYTFMEHGAEGVKNGNVNAFIGINPSYLEPIIWDILDRMYIKGGICFDYVGVDSYPGSWEPGGPDTWKERLDKISSFVQKPIIVAEFGYSSAGEKLTDEELWAHEDLDDVIALMKRMGFYEKELEDDAESVKKATELYKLHHYKKWAYYWRSGHTQQEQALYLREAFKLFTDHPNVIGAFWFCGTDSESCFWCGQKGCPCETSWGLFDVEGHPKKSYFEYKNIIKEAML